ncbi:MAG TPA: VOC family protein [Chloroflexota bacterium]|nr:VOC family protein [Chloroflexota bacterium]
MAVLDHVGIRVTDLDRSIKFYEEMFGFEMIDRRMLTGNEQVESAAMKVGDDNLVFLLYNAEFRAHPPSIEGRPDHFCLIFEPDEFEAVLERLRVAGVLERLDCERRPRTGATGRSDSRYILDPDNHLIEVKVRQPAVAAAGAARGAAGA